DFKSTGAISRLKIVSAGSSACTHVPVGKPGKPRLTIKQATESRKMLDNRFITPGKSIDNTIETTDLNSL
ncbi:MAG: hypothetical protein OSB47_16635, partial [Pirellulaceae bacterium]|nr:hypothetical protein [Pirellulaceae bacterium]